MEPYSPELYPLVIVGFFVAFVLAFGIGANDVANSFGTSVGAKVLDLRQACILASVFEILGAILIGGKVSETIRQGIIDPVRFIGEEREYSLGLIATLSGCCLWMLVATFFKLPVSGTHSIVGSTMGFALVAKGHGAIRWSHFAKIVASWFISPLLSGLISVIVFLMIRKFILRAENPFNRALKWLPMFYTVTILINVISVLLVAPPLFHFNKMPSWIIVIIVCVVGIVTAMIVNFVVKPRMKKKIESSLSKIHKEPEDIQAECIVGERKTFLKSPVELKRLEMDKGIQVDYIALLNDREIMNFITENRSNFFDTRRFSREDSSQSGRRPYAESERSFYAYRFGRERLSRPPERCRYETTLSSDAVMLHSEFKDTISKPEVKPKHFDTPSNDADTVVEVGEPEIDDTADFDEIDDKLPEIKPKSKRKDDVEDSLEVGKLFSFLQILTAVFGSFAHGGNDVSNAIGPLLTLWLVFTNGSVTNTSTPVWVLFYGGVGIIVGLWVWGRRVMKTIGEDLTKITPSSGFVIEISTAFTVLFASNLSIPVSTTHCKVGSVVFTGRIRSKESVDWSLFGNIIIAWLVTVPVTGILSAALTALLRRAVLRV